MKKSCFSIAFVLLLLAVLLAGVVTPAARAQSGIGDIVCADH